MKRETILFGFGILFFIIIAVLLYKFWLITLNLALGFLLYLIFDQVLNFLERKGIKGALAYTLLFLALGIMILSFILFVSIPLFNQLQGLVSDFPIHAARIQEQAQTLVESFPYVQGYFDKGRDQLLNAGKNILSLSATILGTALTAILLAVILLASRSTLREVILSHIPNEYFEVTVSVAHRIIEHLQQFVVARTVQTLAVTAFYSLGFFLIGLPFPLLLGIISGLLNIIPYLGPLLTLVPVGLAAFLGGGTTLALWAMGVVLVVQLLDNAVLQTWLVSKFVDVHPVMAFVVTLVFGEVLGPVGMVIGIPAYVISKILIGGLWDYAKALQRHEQILSYQKTQ